MKLRDRTTKKRIPSLRDRLTRRRTHRLAAHVSREDQWDYDVPNIRLSRAFVVVIVLHIVAVGGILAFEVLKPDARQVGGGSEGPAENGEQERLNLSNALPAGVKIGNPSVEGLEHYIVRAGDTLTSIAAKYGVPVENIEQLNRLDRGGRIYPGRNLFIPEKEMPNLTGEISSLVAGNGQTEGSSSGNLNPPSEAASPTHEPDRVASAAPVVPVAPEAPPAVMAIPASEAQIQTETQQAVEDVSPQPERPRFEVTETPSPEPQRVPEPVKPVSGSDGGSYTIAQGDTAYSIARRHGVNLAELLRYNRVQDPTNLQIGQKLKIPGRR